MSDKKPKRKKVVIRTNVLLLMGTAYTVLIGIFAILVWGTDKITADTAWEMIKMPFMALIGGTLAISKDLIADEISLPNEQLDNLVKPDPNPEKERRTE